MFGLLLLLFPWRFFGLFSLTMVLLLVVVVMGFVVVRVVVRLSDLLFLLHLSELVILLFCLLGLVTSETESSWLLLLIRLALCPEEPTWFYESLTRHDSRLLAVDRDERGLTQEELLGLCVEGEESLGGRLGELNDVVVELLGAKDETLLAALQSKAGTYLLLH